MPRDFFCVMHARHPGAVIAFTHDLFALDIETCKHVSASLGSAVILDRREGIHYFLYLHYRRNPVISFSNLQSRTQARLQFQCGGDRPSFEFWRWRQELRG